MNYTTEYKPGLFRELLDFIEERTRREKFRLFLRKLFQVPFKEITMTTKKKLKAEIELLKFQLKHEESVSTEWRKAFEKSEKRYTELQNKLGVVCDTIVDAAELTVEEKRLFVPNRGW